MREAELDVPSGPESSSPLSSCMISSSSVEMGDMYSSSESISPVVWGVGGAAGRLAEATIFFWGMLSASADVIVASAAFRFLVMGGIVTVVGGQAASLQVDDGALADEIVMQHAKRGPCDGTRWTQVHAGSVGR